METQRKTYPQKWREYTLGQTNEKAKFLELLFGLCEGIEEAPQHMGRPRTPLADRVFASVFKVYSTLSGRRFTTDLRDARQRGYISTTPDYTSVSRFLESEELTPVLKQMIVASSLPLKEVEENFAADSTGFRTKGYSTWFNAKYNKEIDKGEWIKAHVMVGTLTQIVTAVEISSRKDHDSPYFPTLLDRTAQSGFTLREVSADKGYDSFNHRRLVLLKGAIPYITFRSFAQPKGKGELWRRMYHLYSLNRDEFNHHYHRRSNVEAAFSMMKRKFGEKLRSKTETAQIKRRFARSWRIICACSFSRFMSWASRRLLHQIRRVMQMSFDFPTSATKPHPGLCPTEGLEPRSVGQDSVLLGKRSGCCLRMRSSLWPIRSIARLAGVGL